MLAESQRREIVGQLRQARWFGGKSRAIAEVEVVDSACWSADGGVVFVDVTYQAGPTETYVLAEGFPDEAAARHLLDRFQGASVPTERGGKLVFSPTHVLASIPRQRTEPIAALTGEQSNTSVRYGDALILKLFRRLQFGANPDVEIGWFLTEHSSFTGTPAVAGSLEYESPRGQTASLALLQRFEPNRGDAWRTTLARLAGILAGGPMAESIEALARLGATTAELHLALASDSEPFSAERITDADVAAWRAAIERELDHATRALAGRTIHVATDALLQSAQGIESLLDCHKIRHHGDYHLGQVLERDDGSFAIIDFEGEPSRPLALRREKRSPLRDVAGMLRSFDYARHAALRAGGADDDRARALADAWYTAVRAAYLDAYFHTLGRDGHRLVPADPRPALAALELEKAAYEVLYELNNRPDWLAIPLAALTARPD